MEDHTAELVITMTLTNVRLVSEDFTCLKHPTVLNAILLDALFVKALSTVVNVDLDTFYQDHPLQPHVKMR